MIALQTILGYGALIALAGFFLGRQKALNSAGGNAAALNSLPRQYGYYVSAWTLIPGVLIMMVWVLFGQQAVDAYVLNPLISPENSDAALIANRVRLVAGGDQRLEVDPAIIEAGQRLARMRLFGFYGSLSLAVATCLAGLMVSLKRVAADFGARAKVEQMIRLLLLLCSGLAVLITLSIVLSLLFESLLFFSEVSIRDFLFGLQWSPQTALREDQVAASGSFGAVPLFAGTLMVTLIAMLIAAPIGLLAAIYMTQYAGPSFRGVAKPILEVLAGVPTVVYGYFTAVVIAPALTGWAGQVGLGIAPESALAAGIVMGFMIIPYVSSLVDDILKAQPISLIEASLSLGATKSETIINIVLPSAAPGISGAMMLAISRAIGETMIVVMALSMRATLTGNPFDAVSTVTVQIVALVTGDQAFDSPKTLSAFALGLVLFLATLVLNIFALRYVRGRTPA